VQTEGVVRLANLLHQAVEFEELVVRELGCAIVSPLHLLLWQ
jgi:hypothetical protein